MKLTTTDVIEVEKRLEEHKGITYVFSPDDVGEWDHHKYTRQDYLDWLHEQYPDSVCKYTNSMHSDSIHAKVSAYLKIQWQFRNTSLGIIRHNLVRLRDEIVPLRKVKQTLVCLKQAQREMDKLRI